MTEQAKEWKVIMKTMTYWEWQLGCMVTLWTDKGGSIHFNVVFLLKPICSLQAPPRPQNVATPSGCCLNKMYGNIKAYRGLSGVHWDNERGAGIEGEERLHGLCGIHFSNQQCHGTMHQYHNTGWAFYSQVQAILPNGHGAQGHHVFHPASAAASPLVGNMLDSTPSQQDEAPQLTVAGITLRDALMQAPNLSTAVDYSPTMGSMNTSFAILRLPGAPPSTALSIIYILIVSSTLISIPSAAKKICSAHVTSTGSRTASNHIASSLVTTLAVETHRWLVLHKLASSHLHHCGGDARVY
ncbi:hypothetical protein C8R48DRAFT_676666 [Suillus tomentosus]|nr:hypothetical protein C8R48DRAFT_676666 [Suillus tomentosus]